MEKVLFINDHTELCDLLRPFLESKGIELDYCEHSNRWLLKITALSTLSRPLDNSAFSHFAG